MRDSLTTLAKATSTPLASIFGSGFLVIVPILAASSGRHSVLAMACVCALAYGVGSVIRFNIVHTEPVLAGTPPESTLSLERASDLALVLAYVISVCLYIHILSAFVLAAFHVDTPLHEDLLTTVVIATITVLGFVRGLHMLESLEEWSLWVTLLIIAALLAGFGHYDLAVWRSARGFTWFTPPEHSPWEILTIVAGTLIVVQGFETPRYLADDYDAETRVRASRLSQIISTAVYVVFVALALPVVHTLGGTYDDNSLIELVTAAAGFLAVPLVVAAALSQFSAAVADMLAAVGNVEEVTHEHLTERFGYVLIGGGAVMLTWSVDTFQIIALASRAFAFYYMLQCLVAVTVSTSPLQRAGIVLLAAVLAFIAVFSVPAS